MPSAREVEAPTAAFAAESAAEESCGGIERWAVKVAADPDSGRIDTTPEALGEDGISLLNQMQSSPNGNASDDDTRLPEERKTYTIRGYVAHFHIDKRDDDYHIVVTDQTLRYNLGGQQPTGHSVIVEIPDPDCLHGRNNQVTGESRFLDKITRARSMFQQETHDVNDSGDPGQAFYVEVTGVLFFDRPHGQKGRSLHAVELHPVTGVSFPQDPHHLTSFLAPRAVPQNLAYVN
jgi:hypothetical protein